MLKRVTLTFVGGALLAGLASGCSKSTQSDDLAARDINAEAIISDTSLVPADKAEQLAKSAEQLLTVQGFAYASDVADLALAQDPKNLRAKFVKAVLAPIMAQKGILARLAPLAEKDAGMKTQYDEMMADIEAKSPNSTLKAFLLDGQPDIKTEGDIQAYLDSVADGFAALKSFAKENKDQSLTVTASDTLYNAMMKRWEDSCTVVPVGHWRWRYTCPSAVNVMEVNFNRADFEGVQEFAAGYELYLSLYNSYDLSGAIQVALNHKNDQASPGAQKIIDELLTDAKFAKLRAKNGFKKIKEMGLDAVAGLRWIMKNQNTLCPLGTESPRNRIGALFNQGLCVEDESMADLAKGLKKAEAALAGGTIQVVFNDQYGIPYVSILKPTALMDAPIADLRSLTPLSLNRCGQLTGVKDGSIGGLFPNGDANKVLAANNACWPY